MSKENEYYYDYWQNQFREHDNYMISNHADFVGSVPNDTKEFYLIREHILEFINNNDSVLDVGCASGGTYLHIKDFSFKKIKYKGIDYVENFIESCKKRHPEANWEVSDARDLIENDKSWDVVLLYDTLDYLMNPDRPLKWKKAIDEAVRVAKKRIIIVIWSDIKRDAPRIRRYLKNKVKLKEIELNSLPKSPHLMLIGEK